MKSLISCFALMSAAILGLSLAIALVYSVKSISRQPQASSSISMLFITTAGMIEFAVILVVILAYLLNLL